MQKLTPYFQKAIIKTYYLFEMIGPAQILRTRDTTLAMISKLKENEYKELRDRASMLAGARLIEEEIVNGRTSLTT
jgi:hypothetical protein